MAHPAAAAVWYETAREGSWCCSKSHSHFISSLFHQCPLSASSASLRVTPTGHNGMCAEEARDKYTVLVHLALSHRKLITCLQEERALLVHYLYLVNAQLNWPLQ